MKKIISVCLALFVMCFSLAVISFSADINDTIDKLDDVTVFDGGDAVIGTYDGDEDDIDDIIDVPSLNGVQDEEDFEDVLSQNQDTEAIIDNLMQKPSVIVAVVIAGIGMLLFIPMLIVMIVFIVLNSKAKKKIKEYEKGMYNYNPYIPNAPINNNAYPPVNSVPVNKEENDDE